MAADFAALDLPQLFSPAQAAEILRSLGLPEMTECALRTRAYRGQVPFHLNGRRIRFTITDLREIAEGSRAGRAHQTTLTCQYRARRLPRPRHAGARARYPAQDRKRAGELADHSTV